MKIKEGGGMENQKSKELSFDTQDFPKEVWVFDADNLDQGAEISHLMMSHAEEYTKDELLVICRKAAMVIDQLRTDLVKAQAVLQWISTSERMPDEGEEVLVHSLGQVRQVTRDSKWAGGFKERNCYGWQAAYGQSHWMPKSIELPEQYHFYYENDAKQKAMIEAQEPAND